MSGSEDSEDEFYDAVEDEEDFFSADECSDAGEESETDIEISIPAREAMTPTALTDHTLPETVTATPVTPTPKRVLEKSSLVVKGVHKPPAVPTRHGYVTATPPTPLPRISPSTRSKGPPVPHRPEALSPKALSPSAPAPPLPPKRKIEEMSMSEEEVERRKNTVRDISTGKEYSIDDRGDMENIHKDFSLFPDNPEAIKATRARAEEEKGNTKSMGMRCQRCLY